MLEERVAVERQFDAEVVGFESWDDPGAGGAEHLSEQSECQSFFSHNLELLARLAEVLPEKLATLDMPEWHYNCSVYLALENTLQLKQVSITHSHLFILLLFSIKNIMCNYLC